MRSIVVALALLPACGGRSGVSAPPNDEVFSEGRGHHDPDFTAEGGGIGEAVAVGDFDGNGFDDLATIGTTHDGVAVFADPGDGWPDPPELGLTGLVQAVGLATVDFDGDGFDELVVAHNNGVQGNLTVFTGSPSGLSDTGRVVFSGAGLGVSFGTSVADAGDIDGDGRGDLVVGAPDDRLAHVYLGANALSTRLPAHTSSKPGEEEFGWAVAGVGDLDGDGYDEFAVTAPGAIGARGAVFVTFGSAAGPSSVTRIYGTVIGAGFGRKVVPVGDTNGDGLREIATSNGDDSGVLVHQHVQRTFTLLKSLLITTQQVDGYGATLAGLDHNGDGFGDLAVGAPGSDLVGLYMGRPGGFPGVRVDQAFRAPFPGDRFGSALAVVSDPTLPEGIVVGFSGADPGGAIAVFEGVRDFDHDQVYDDTEVDYGLDPLDPDTDGDGLPDGQEWGEADPLDTDGDGQIDALDLDSDADSVGDDVDNCPVDVNPDQSDLNYNGIGNWCDYEPGRCNPLDPALEDVVVQDIGWEVGFDDMHFGHRKRGRALVAADFDLNGSIDFYFGNPGDESYVVKSVPDGAGGVRFEFAQQLANPDDIAFAAAAADYDNDGDYDLYVGMGGPACAQLDRLYKNLLKETGTLQFEDVSVQAGIQGRRDPQGNPLPQPATGVTWVDVDRDGDQDVMAVNYSKPTDGKCGEILAWQGRNNLWRNNGDGTFTDITEQVGVATLDTHKTAVFTDYDNDGDPDYWEVNLKQPNRFFHNDLVETGTLHFRDVTAQIALEGSDVANPIEAFAGCAEDFNNDGWQDLIGFYRGGKDCEAPDGDRFTHHSLHINRGDRHFEDMADAWQLNNAGVYGNVGAMGCQIGDANGDGWIDAYFGNGGPAAGEQHQFYLWGPEQGRFLDASMLIDFVAPSDVGNPGEPSVSAYPYRGHGTAFVDIDNDGANEIAVNNGGGEAWPDYVREAERMFKFDWGRPTQYLKVRPVGDGVNVSKDGIGTRIAVTATLPGGGTRTVYRHLPGGSCFSAQNGFDVYFGLTGSVAVQSVEVIWTDGRRTTVTPVPSINSSVVVDY